jgi:hypothetical protein
MSSQQACTSLVASVPQAVWTGVIGSVITLLGVFVANVLNIWSQRRQQAFDAEQNKLERSMTLRQELYVPMIDILSKAMFYFIALPELKFDGKELVEEDGDTALSQLDMAVAKLTLISEASTAVLANKLHDLFSEVHSELLDSSGPLRNAQMAAHAINLSKVELEEHFERVTKALESRHESGAKKDEGWNNLIKQQEKFLTEIESREKAYSEMLKTEGLERIKYLQKFAERKTEIEIMTLELIVAMRSELTSSNDESTLLAEFQHKIKNSRSKLEEDFKKAEESLKDK